MPRLVRVASADEIPAGGGQVVEVDGVPLAVFNAGGAVDGPADRPAVICPWHGFDSDLRTGACLIDPEPNIPAPGSQRTRERFSTAIRRSFR